MDDDIFLLNQKDCLIQVSPIFYEPQRDVWHMSLKHLGADLKLRTFLYLTKKFLDFLRKEIINDGGGVRDSLSLQSPFEFDFFPILDSLNKMEKKSKRQINVLTVIGSENYILFYFYSPLIEKGEEGPFKHQFKVGIEPNYLLYENQPMNCLHPGFNDIADSLHSGSFMQNGQLYIISKEIYVDKGEILKFDDFADKIQVIMLESSQN